MSTAKNVSLSLPKDGARKKSRIFVVDDHPMICEGLERRLGNEPDLQVCGVAKDAEEALTSIAACQPDLVLTDLTLPGKGGLELIKDIKAMHPRLLVVVHSMHDELIYAGRALQAGARGYLSKSYTPEKLIQGIRKALKGEICVSEQTVAGIVNAYAGQKRDGPFTPIHLLSGREFEVFRLMGDGLSTVQIAERLHLSSKTVETHRSRIKKKMKIGSAQELTAFAARWVESELLGLSGKS